MKLGPVNKLDRRNKQHQKKIVKFEAILKPDSKNKACKTYTFINSNLLFYKN